MLPVLTPVIRAMLGAMTVQVADEVAAHPVGSAVPAAMRSPST